MDWVKDLERREFRVADRDYEVRKMPFSQSRPMADIIRCALPRLPINSDDPGASNLGEVVVGAVAMITSEEWSRLERGMFRYVFVSVPGADVKQELLPIMDSVFDGNVATGYEVMVRCLCATFLEDFRPRLNPLVADLLTSDQPSPQTSTES